MPPLSDAARRFRAARAFAGFRGRTDFAKAIQISPATLQRIEGVSEPSRPAKRSELLAIADVTGVPMWFLEGGWDGWRATGPGEAGGSRSDSTDEKARQAKGDLQRGGDQAEPGPGGGTAADA